MRRVILSCVLVLALVPSWSREPRLDLFRAGPGEIASRRVALDAADPARRRIGSLIFLGGVALTSPDPAFGGFSALYVSGDRFTLLGDGGGIVRFRMDAAGRVSAATFADLPSGPGGDWQKRDRDSESMAIDPATGAIWVGFERWNAIWRYTPGFAGAAARARPQAMRRWRDNSGPETLVRRRDGSFVVISESTRPRGLVFAGDPTRTPPAFGFSLRPPPGWRATDAVELPDRRMLVLLRRISGLRFESALMLVEAGAIRPGVSVGGRIVARLAPPLIHDNFEGVAVTRERGRTIVWLVSDDNLSALQRTLLLKFALDAPVADRR